jgi:hypothetical protein
MNCPFRGKYHLHLQGRKSVEQVTIVQQVVKQNSDQNCVLISHVRPTLQNAFPTLQSFDHSNNIRNEYKLSIQLREFLYFLIISFFLSPNISATSYSQIYRASVLPSIEPLAFSLLCEPICCNIYNYIQHVV